MEEDADNTVPIEADDGWSCLERELETLQAIYVNEIEVEQDEQKLTSVSIDLHPATADKLDEQYVRITLKFTLNDKYPQTIPEICIRNPRGLSDEKLNSIIEDLKSIAENKRNNFMLFEIIEAAKEHLTVENRPCGECAICLCGFSDKDVFTKTDCYHYFHSHCLARYSKNAAIEEKDKDSNAQNASPNKEFLCPVCRLPIHFEGSEELYPPPSMADDAFEISEEILDIQKKMADLYQKQVDNGGIIDIEAEKNKYLLEISNVPTRVNAATEEVDSSDNLSKTEENTSAASQSLQKNKEEGLKDAQSISRNEPKGNSGPPEEKTKNDKKYNRQPRNNNYNSYRSNKRYDKYSNPKFKSEKFEKDVKEDADGSSPSKSIRNPETNSEDPCNDSNSVSKTSPGARSSNTSSYKRNDRRPNNYGPPRRYYEEDYGRRNYYKNPDSRNNRGRGYGTNAYDRRNFRDQGYRGRRRSNSDRETTVDESHQNDSKFIPDSVPPQETNEPLDQENTCDSSRDNVRYERDYTRNKRYPRGKHPGNSYNERRTHSQRKTDSRVDDASQDAHKQEENDQDHKGEKDGNTEKFSSDSYRDRRPYSDRRHYSDARTSSYTEREAQSRRKENYYSHNRTRGSYRNPVHQDNLEATTETKEFEERDTDIKNCIADESNKFPVNPKSKFTERQSSSSNRDNIAHNRRNVNSYRHSQENSRRYEEGRDVDLGNGTNEPHGRKNPHGNSDVGISSSYDENEVRSQRQEDYSQESSSKDYKNSHEEYPKHYGNKRDGYNTQRGFRDPDRNRNNSDFQNKNSNFRRNQRYTNERPSYRNRNDSYQYRNNPSRKYSDRHTDQSQQNGKPEISEFPGNNAEVSGKSIDETNLKKVPDSLNERELLTKQTTSKPSESSKEVDVSVKIPAVNPKAHFVSNSPKMPKPPPGFSNPLKKVVYGLQAANPPPGFPRS